MRLKIWCSIQSAAQLGNSALLGGCLWDLHAFTGEALRCEASFLTTIWVEKPDRQTSTNQPLVAANLLQQRPAP